jgi:DNA-binding response OmpR family regulator
MAKILIVDDDRALAILVSETLKDNGFVTDAVHSGVEARTYVHMMPYDLLILDWELPDVTGPVLCDEFRGRGLNTPVLFLTGRVGIKDKAAGFASGGDDYLTKPFSVEELVMRVQALLRRPPVIHNKELKVRDIVLEPSSFTATKNGNKINLLPKEFALLEFFMKHPNQLFSVDALIDRVWPTDAEATPETVRVTLMRVRQKVDDSDKPLIVTIRGVGYRLEP